MVKEYVLNTHCEVEEENPIVKVSLKSLEEQKGLQIEMYDPQKLYES